MRLQSDKVAKHSPLIVFVMLTGTIVALPKENGTHPTIYYYAVVIKHPNEGKSPAELITEDHTILPVSFFLQNESLRRAESQLYS